jgi:hypothetical protein
VFYVPFLFAAGDRDVSALLKAIAPRFARGQHSNLRLRRRLRYGVKPQLSSSAQNFLSPQIKPHRYFTSVLRINSRK